METSSQVGWTSLTGKLLALFFAISLSLGGCQSPPDEFDGVVPPAEIPQVEGREKGVEGPDPSLIQVGDQLEMFVMEDDSFNRALTVREQGDVILQPFGRVPVAGLSVKQAEQRIRDLLEESQLKKATVILDRTRQARRKSPESQNPVTGEDAVKILVFMTGKVNRPGQHVLTLPGGRPVGVYEAILISGGLDRFGDEQKVHVLRADENNVRHKIPVNVRAISQGREADPPIGNGDIVVVPEKVFGF